MIILILGVFLFSRWGLDEVILLSGTPGGTYEPLATEVLTLLDDVDPRPFNEIKIEPSSGSKENLQRVREGTAQFAFVAGHILHEREPKAGGNGPENVRVVARLDTDYVQVIVPRESNAKTLSDFLSDWGPTEELPRISVGENKDSGTALAAERLLHVIGFGENKRFAPTYPKDYVTAAEQLQKGDLDAAFFVGSLRTRAVDGLLTGGQFKLLPLTKIAESLRVLELDTHNVQVVVPRESDAETLYDFLSNWGSTEERPRISVGEHKDSGTALDAKRLLQFIGFDENEGYTPKYPEDYVTAAGQLQKGVLDAAFFVGSLSTGEVEGLLTGGQFKLLSLSETDKRLQAHKLDNEYFTKLFESPEFEPDDIIETIQKGEYPNQSAAVETIIIRAYLICPRSLDDDVVECVAQTVFDGLYQLQIVHSGKEEFRPADIFRIPKPLRLQLHPGAVAVKERVMESLLITTGAFGGKYHEIGRRLKAELAALGLYATVTHSEGSIENARMLGGQGKFPHDGPVIAIMQRDLALVSRHGVPGLVYRVAPLPRPNGEHEDEEVDAGFEVDDLTLIARLHPEKMHLIVRKSIANEIKRGEGPSVLAGKTIGIGAADSGSQLTSRAVLAHLFRNAKAQPNLKHYPVNDMLRLVADQENGLDAAMFTAFAPSALIRKALDRGDVELVSIDPSFLVGNTIPAISRSTIPKGVYPNMAADLVTVETQAIVACIGELPQEYGYKIAEALDRVRTLLLPQLKPEAMALAMPSLPTHRGARQYYVDRGYLSPGPKPAITLLATVSLLLALPAVLKALHSLLKHMKEVSLRRKIILALTMQPGPDAAEELAECGRDINWRACRPWWRLRSLTLAKWGNWRELLRAREAELECIAADDVTLTPHPPKGPAPSPENPPVITDAAESRP